MGLSLGLNTRISFLEVPRLPHLWHFLVTIMVFFALLRMISGSYDPLPSVRQKFLNSFRWRCPLLFGSSFSREHGALSSVLALRPGPLGQKLSFSMPTLELDP